MMSAYQKKLPVLSEDKVKLVLIYSQKLTLLTKRQRVIFDLLSHGFMLKDTASHIGIAEITAKVEKAKIFKLLGISSLQELAVLAQCTSCNYIKEKVAEAH